VRTLVDLDLDLDFAFDFDLAPEHRHCCPGVGASPGSFAPFDEKDAVLLNLSPVGVFEAPPEHGTPLRTDPFRAPFTAAGEKAWPYQPDSGERYDFVRASRR